MSLPSKKDPNTLHLIYKPKNPNPNSPQPFFWGSLIGALLIVATLSYFALYQTTPQDVSLASFSNLDSIYKKEGLQAFLREKEALKEKIREQLKDQSHPELADEALNIAVFLFPEILPKENLERDVGESDWKGKQEEIEKSPKTLEARRSFEDMRANIWNYESPSRDFPQISETAKQVIKIYEDISTP